MPYPALMECQHWISKNILSKVKIHYTAHGFANKKSIITHSKIHIDKNHLLKIDLKDFFSTITINQVITVFNSLGYNHWISFYLASICCSKGVLPQGAPTSPILSNIVAKTLDRRLIKFAMRFNLHYSRYADDLAFSGEIIPVKFIEYITLIINSCGFKVNEEKTKLFKYKGKRILTGISISDKCIKVPRDYKRNLRMEIHCIRKFGLHNHFFKKQINNQDYYNNERCHGSIAGLPPSKFWALYDMQKIETIPMKNNRTKFKVKVAYQDIKEIPEVDKYEHRGIRT